MPEQLQGSGQKEDRHTLLLVYYDAIQLGVQELARSSDGMGYAVGWDGE